MIRVIKNLFLHKRPKKIFSKFTKIDGIRLHYLKSGHSDSKLLFMHGLGAGCDAYHEAIEILAMKHEVYALDLPSFGKSQLMKKPFRINDYIELVASFLKKMKLEKVILVGHSAGGLLSIEITSNPATRKFVKKLVLIDSAGLPKTTDNLRFLTNLAVINPMNHYMELRQNSKEDKFFDIMTNAVSILGNNIKHKNLYIFATLLFNWSHTCESKLKKIRIETMLLWADKDELFPLEDAYQFKKMIRGSSLKIVKGYHNWICFNPSKGKKAILEI